MNHEVSVSDNRRAVLARRVRVLVAATIAYNMFEAAVAISAGAVASSAALIGFGLDSLIEVASAAAVAWQFSGCDHEVRERAALRIIAISFFALAAYVTVESLRALFGAAEAAPSTVGIALAAEFLKNLGFNVAKPDRHVNRAAGSFGWVAFRNWDRRGRGTPKATPTETRLVMRAVTEFSKQQGLAACFADNAVWLLCAKSVLWLDNAALAALGDRST